MLTYLLLRNYITAEVNKMFGNYDTPIYLFRMLHSQTFYRVKFHCTRRAYKNPAVVALHFVDKVAAADVADLRNALERMFVMQSVLHLEARAKPGEIFVVYKWPEELSGYRCMSHVDVAEYGMEAKRKPDLPPPVGSLWWHKQRGKAYRIVQLQERSCGSYTVTMQRHAEGEPLRDGQHQFVFDGDAQWARYFSLYVREIQKPPKTITITNTVNFDDAAVRASAENIRRYVDEAFRGPLSGLREVWRDPCRWPLYSRSCAPRFYSGGFVSNVPNLHFSSGHANPFGLGKEDARYFVVEPMPATDVAKMLKEIKKRFPEVAKAVTGKPLDQVKIALRRAAKKIAELNETLKGALEANAALVRNWEPVLKERDQAIERSIALDRELTSFRTQAMHQTADIEHKQGQIETLERCNRRQEETIKGLQTIDGAVRTVLPAVGSVWVTRSTGKRSVVTQVYGEAEPPRVEMRGEGGAMFENTVEKLHSYAFLDPAQTLEVVLKHRLVTIDGGPKQMEYFTAGKPFYVREVVIGPDDGDFAIRGHVGK